MMNPFGSHRNTRRICLVLLDRFGKFLVCTSDLAHKSPFALCKLCLDRLKSSLFFQAQAELPVNPFMATDSGLRVQRSEYSGADVTCGGSNEGYDDEHRDELQRLVHRDWLKRVEGKVGASDGKPSNPKGLW